MYLYADDVSLYSAHVINCDVSKAVQDKEQSTQSNHCTGTSIVVLSGTMHVQNMQKEEQ